MLRKLLPLVLILAPLAASAADIQPWKDYEPSEAVWSITTVRVKPNLDDEYLQGLIKTWVAGNEISKKLGQIEDYEIYRSDLPQSGDFNLMLIVKFAKTSDLGPNKARYEAFMKEFTKPRADETSAYSQKNYPAMREITGQYLFRKITLK
jgi:hypothetical protein